jgi:hypothetical protein
VTDSATYGGPGPYGADAGQGLYGGPIGTATVNIDVTLAGSTVEIGCDWRDLSIRYGRTDYLQAFAAGQASFELYGADGAYSAWNPDGLWAQANPGTPYRMDVPVVLGVNAGTAATTALFTGTTDKVVEDWPDWVDQRVQVDMSDGFKLLARVKVPTATVLPAELSGARINRLLDRAAWPAAARRIDAGLQSLASTTLTADTAVLDLLHIAGEAEWGWLYVDVDGAVVFRQRDAYQTDPRMANVTWSFTDTHATAGVCYATLTLAADDDVIYNRANITPADGSAIRTTQVPPSVAWYGPRDYNRADLPLPDATAADQFGSLVTTYYADNERRIDAVEFEAVSQGDLGLAIATGVRINDRIRVYRLLAPHYTMVDDLLVQGIDHKLTPAGANRWPATWTVKLATAKALDVHLWGQWDVGQWDVARWGP